VPEQSSSSSIAAEPVKKVENAGTLAVINVNVDSSVFW